MRKKLVRVAKIGGAILVIAAVAFGVVMGVTFWGIDPVVGGAVAGVGVSIDDGYVSCHYVEVGDDAIVLVDACVSEDAAAIIDALSSAGYDQSSVTAILLTHGHGDHRGGVGRFPSARVYAHRDELALLRGEARSRGPIPWLSGYAEPLDDVVVVGDGETVDLGGISATAFHLPGHTEGSAAWLIGDTLFLGDAAASREGRVSGAPWVFSDDAGRSDRSLAALPARLDAAALVVDWLVFSHSSALRGMEPLREFARDEGH